MPEDTTETKITSIDDAVESILAPIEEPTEEVIESQATEEISAETETEEVVEEEEEEVLEASESEDDEDQEEDAVQEETPTFSVKVDGNIEEVTLDELKQGYSGQKYVQTGMQDVAKMKKEVEDVYAAMTSSREQVEVLLKSLQNGGLTPPPEKPTKEIFDADPIGYMEQNIEYEDKKVIYDKQMAQFQQVLQQNSEASQNARQAYLEEQTQILQRDIPEFADTNLAGKLKDQLVSIGSNYYGYSNDEISNITDARAIKVLNDAMKYQDIIAGKTKAKVKTQSAKPVLKPGAKRMATPDAKIRSRQQAKLRKSGSIEDALGLIVQS